MKADAHTNPDGSLASRDTLQPLNCSQSSLNETPTEDHLQAASRTPQNNFAPRSALEEIAKSEVIQFKRTKEASPGQAPAPTKPGIDRANEREGRPQGLSDQSRAKEEVRESYLIDNKRYGGHHFPQPKPEAKHTDLSKTHLAKTNLLSFVDPKQSQSMLRSRADTLKLNLSRQQADEMTGFIKKNTLLINQVALQNTFNVIRKVSGSNEVDDFHHSLIHGKTAPPPAPPQSTDLPPPPILYSDSLIQEMS